MRSEIERALRQYLSLQPEYTASYTDSKRAVSEMLGYPVSKNAMYGAKRRLGITSYQRGVPGAKSPEPCYVGIWTLPIDKVTVVEQIDRTMARKLVAAYGTEEFPELMEYALNRAEQVMTVLIAAFAKAQAKRNGGGDAD
jgi:hypothetical protein